MAGRRIGDVMSKFESKLGKIHYRISYDNGSQNLNVHVMECQNLKKMDTFGKSDPYVKVYLLPGGFDIMKTDVIKKNLNPYFNAMFRFNVAKREIMNKTIVFQVFDWEKIGKEEAIGEAQIPIWQLNLNTETDAWKDLHKVTGTKDKPAIVNPSGSSRPPSYVGSPGAGQSPGAGVSGVPELKYELLYEPGQMGQNGHLVLTIAECRNLKGADLRGGKPDTYVQVYLLPGTHKELKTKVVNNNNNPVFQETMKFQIPQEKIHDRSIVLHVMDKDKFSKDDKMGEVQIQLNKVDLSRKASVWREIGPVTMAKPGKSPTKSRASSSDDEKSQRRSMSPQASSGSTGPPMIKYRIRYEHGSKNLLVAVLEARNLKNNEFGVGKSKAPDCYVQLMLADNQKPVKTKTIKNNYNPSWNEEFRFSVPLQSVSNYDLTLRVMDDDMITKDDPLGEVVIPLWQIDFSTGVEEMKQLQAVTKKTPSKSQKKRSDSVSSFSSDEEMKKSANNFGRLKYNLSIDPSTNKVLLGIIKAKHLKKGDMMSKADPYVLISVPGVNFKPIKTKSIKSTQEPVWNETHTFDINDVAGKTFILQVFDKDMMKDDGLGEIHVPVSLLDRSQKIEEWKYLSKYSGKVAAGPSPSKRQSTGKQQKSRSRSSSDERKSSKSTPGAPSIHYQINYKHGTLAVTVLECKNLKKADVMGSVDSYVEVSLVPWSTKPEKTETIKKNQNPVFNHTVQFQVPEHDISNQTLFLQVFDWDRFTKNDAVGEVKIQMGYVDLSRTVDEWRQLMKYSGKPKPLPVSGHQTSVKEKSSKSSSSSSDEDENKKPPAGPPKIHYRVQYDRSYQALKVSVIECKDLRKTDMMMGKIDPYVQVYLLHGSYDTYKTKTMKKNYNPVFNETFSYPISITDVMTKTVVLQVVDDDKISKDDAVGEIQIPLWKIDLHGLNDQWAELHKVTGTRGKPQLFEQPQVTQQSVSHVNSVNNGRKTSVSSMSSSDEEVLNTHNMSLKQLNDMLLQYINQVRDMDSMETSINMNVDRREVDALHVKYDAIVRDWKSKYERAEHDLADARANQGNIGDLQREITHLRSQLDAANKSRNQEQMRSSDLESKLRSMETDLRNRITILETELANEKSRGSIDMSSFDSRMKGEYEERLKKELKTLRKLYKANMKHSQEEFMRSHNQKIADLERALAYEKNHNSSAVVEARNMRVQVEDLRRRIGELETSNQSLGHRASELQVNMEDQAAKYESKIAGKDQEIAYLKQEIQNIKRQYEDIYGTKLEDLAEVKVYSGLIVPELQRMRHQSRSRAKSVTRKASTSSISSSDEEKMRQRKSRNTSRTMNGESMI